MNDADELGPHGKPLPPTTWTPEREAAVARWRDELMEAGERRDRQRIEPMRDYFERLAGRHGSIEEISRRFKVEPVEVKFWYAIWKLTTVVR